jgi:outer membrane protein
MLLRILISIIFFSCLSAEAQTPKKWNLLQCIQYAMDNNLLVRQAQIQTRLNELILKQSKLSQYPNLNYAGNVAYSSGRNQDPTSFSLITKSYLSSSMSLQTGVELFNWYSKRNTIAANVIEVDAAKAAVEKQRSDIALIVANSYLQILLAKEQYHISEVQLQQSQAQLANVRKLVKAGALPELNAAELEAQVATDSAMVISAKGNIDINYFFLKTYMNIDAAQPLEIEEPPADKIPVENIADLQPEYVFSLALKNLPQQRVNDLKYMAAQKNTEAMKGAMMPTITAFGSLGTSFNNRAQNISGVTFYTVPIGKVTVGGTNYDVLPVQPFSNYTFSKPGLFTQYGDNFRQSIGLSINVPIFNNGTLRTNYERSKLNIESLGLQREQDNQKLKQDIYQAYNAALIAMEKFNASKKIVEAAQRTFDFSSKRFNVGMLSTFELTTNQNNLYKAKLQQVLDEFDYVFKIKVLEFYKGQGLKL